MKNTFLEKLMAFIIFDILVALLIFGLILFWTVLIWMSILGLIFYVIAIIRVYFLRWRRRKYGETGIIEHDPNE
jgi:hypothetical protein